MTLGAEFPGAAPAPAGGRVYATCRCSRLGQMLEVQQAFLRRLDDFGVVRPTRSSGGQRRYSRTEITIVRYVA